MTDLCSHVDIHIMILGVGPEAREPHKVGDERSGGCRVEEGAVMTLTPRYQPCHLCSIK
jgi:hypothetical protein